MEHEVLRRQAPLKILEALRHHLEESPNINTGAFRAAVKIRDEGRYEVVVVDVMVFARLFYNRGNEATIYVRNTSLRRMITHMYAFPSEEPWKFTIIGVPQEYLFT